MDWRAFDSAIATEHAAISGEGPKHRRAMLAVIEELTGIGRHHLGRAMATVRTGDDGFKKHRPKLVPGGKPGNCATSIEFQTGTLSTFKELKLRPRASWTSCAKALDNVGISAE